MRNYVQEIGCSSYGYDEQKGCRCCLVSGDACMFYLPSSLKCARKWGEGPDAEALAHIEKELGYLKVSQMSATEINNWFRFKEEGPGYKVHTIEGDDEW